MRREQLEMERRNCLKRRSADRRRLPFRRRIQSIFTEKYPLYPIYSSEEVGLYTHILSDFPHRL
jgi:hypothetical protein